MPLVRHPDRLGLHIRVVLEGGAMIGPGRAELLEHVRETGSIAAAGRAMGMSYKRAWDLADALNGSFSETLIEPVRGGAGGGGARLTPAGERVLRDYRTIEVRASRAAAAEIASLTGLGKRGDARPRTTPNDDRT